MSFGIRSTISRKPLGAFETRSTRKLRISRRATFCNRHQRRKFSRCLPRLNCGEHFIRALSHTAQYGGQLARSTHGSEPYTVPRCAARARRPRYVHFSTCDLRAMPALRSQSRATGNCGRPTVPSWITRWTRFLSRLATDGRVWQRSSGVPVLAAGIKKAERDHAAEPALSVSPKRGLQVYVWRP